MTTKRLLMLLVVVLAVTVAVVQTRRGGPAGSAALTFHVTGVVTSPIADRRVMVAHDEIPGYMPAMTMPFAVAGNEEASLRAGDRVRFTLRVTTDGPQAEGFEVTGHDAAVAAALREEPRPSLKRLKKGDEIPMVTLTTSEGRPLTTASLRGQVTAVTFIFTRCPVPDFCPLMMKRFQEVQRELETRGSPRDVQLLSITLDPAFDTPQVLQAYGASKGVDTARWQLATGTAEEIATLTSAFSIHVERGGVLIDHTLATAVIGRDGRIVEIWRGNGWSAADVLDALR
jgi:protein SCO1/2